LIILNSIVPVFAVICLGTLLKRSGLTNSEFLKISDRLVYYVLFPLMIFWKVGSPGVSPLKGELLIAVLTTILLLYIMTLIYIKAARVPAFEAGSFSQCSYRFNTYVGMAVILTALGDGPVRQFSILIGFAIPFINLLAVSTLIWFSGKRSAGYGKISLMLKKTVSNPLIIGCVGGLIYSKTGYGFPLCLENTFRLVSFMTLPLALISIGGNLAVSNLKRHLKTALASVFFKLVVLPVTGLVLMSLFKVDPASMLVGMIFFSLPTSTATYILSSQLDSDRNLASASIFLSTLISILSLSAVISIFS